MLSFWKCLKTAERQTAQLFASLLPKKLYQFQKEKCIHSYKNSVGGREVEIDRDKCVERSKCKPDLELPVRMNQVLKREKLHHQRERGTPTR